MAASTSNPVKSREEYLKRYLNPADSKKKKKKIKAVVPVKKSVGLKIIDADIDVRVDNDDIEDEVGEEAPVVAAIIDERPVEEQFKTRKKYSQWQVDDEDALSTQNSDSKSQPSLNRSVDSDGDLSPIREASTVKLPDMRKRKRHDSSDSNSSHEPPGASQNRSSSNGSSFPEQSQKSGSTSQHTLSKAALDSDGDLSPPRIKSSSLNSNFIVDSDGDLSPVRERGITSQVVDSDGDLCSPRRSGTSLTSGSGRSSSKTLVSRRRHDSSSDRLSGRSKSGSVVSHKQDSQVKRQELSRSESKNSSSHKSHSSKDSHLENTSSTEEDTSKPGKKFRPDTTLSGLKAGLQSASLLREEADNLRKKQAKHIREMNDELSGRNAEVVHRDRSTGKKRDFEKERKLTEEEKKKKAEKEAKYAEWGRGVEQRAEQIKQFQLDCYEMTKPLARYQDDEDLDRVLKEQEREGDPMLEYIMKKKKKTQKGPVYPEYKGPAAPPNRFGIKPGYRWDGVDRSNGFERRYFEKVNVTKSKETEAHLWSVQDM